MLVVPIMEWKVWPGRGFCSYGDKTSAYVDFNPTPCGAIRCVGPFSIDIPPQSGVMKDLTSLLEKKYIDPDQFVVWGTYCDFPQFEEHKMEIQGLECGFIPAPWMRTSLLGIEEQRMAREWIITPKSVTHRSGLKFPDTPLSVVDSMLFHPTLEVASVMKLNAYSMQLHSGIAKSNKKKLPSLPSFHWTLCNNVEKRQLQTG